MDRLVCVVAPCIVIRFFTTQNMLAAEIHRKCVWCTVPVTDDTVMDEFQQLISFGR